MKRDAQPSASVRFRANADPTGTTGRCTPTAPVLAQRDGHRLSYHLLPQTPQTSSQVSIAPPIAITGDQGVKSVTNCRSLTPPHHPSHQNHHQPLNHHQQARDMSPPVPPQKSSTRFIVKRPDEASAEPAKPWDVLRTGSTSTPVPNMKRCLLPCDTLSSSPQLTAQLLASSKELENGVTKIESHDYGQELLSALRQHKFEQDTAMAELRGHFEKRLKEMEGTLRSNVEIATTTASAVKDLSDRLLRLSESFEAYQSEGCSATDVLILQSQIMQTQRWITQLSERLGSGEEARQLGLTNGSERETQVNSIQDKGLSFLAEDDDEAQSTRVDSQDGASCGSGSREGGNDQHDLEQRISQIYREVERAFRVDVPDSMTTNGCDNGDDGSDSLSNGSNINMSMLSSYYTSSCLQHAREAQMRDACYDITEATPHHPADNDPSSSVGFLPSANFKRNRISTNCAPIPEEPTDNGEDTNVNGQGEDTNGAMGS